MKTPSFPIVSLFGVVFGLSSDFTVGQSVVPVPQLKSAESKATPRSFGVDAVADLVRSKVNDSVVLAFIDNSPIAYQPTADEIIELNSLGASSAVLTSLMKHGRELRRLNDVAQAPPAQTSALQAPAIVVYAPSPAPSPAPAPVVVSPNVTYTSYPSCSYYPSHPYSYSYSTIPSFYWNGGYRYPVNCGFRGSAYRPYSAGSRVVASRQYSGGHVGGGYGGGGSHRGGNRGGVGARHGR